MSGEYADSDPARQSATEKLDGETGFQESCAEVEVPRGRVEEHDRHTYFA
ncbi:hypothetical protein [Rhodococcus artemisiae]|uniref:Uncharacterized protein n=1 Tax=Rhodococcus artemisiae TaxID=714159 RepID=A0ABU7LJM2_9NOCA|nr:hypothetical protein [Rhodococcus artemisiae]MEE2061744.1 hypothetical protein [Rhodococcus artemisiae]